ncbi:MAG TPA: hypothetical protein VHW67_03735 [Solirubrobacteraceae bacterium]|nr:hypothetical protein [Solirubrobacteraceae bacterium]
MTELLEAVGGVAIYVVLFGLLAWALYFAFGPQVLGLPAMIGVFAVIAGVKVLGNVGIVGLVFVVLALAAVVVVIGMAMTLGGRPPTRPPDERPVDEP